MKNNPKKDEFFNLVAKMKEENPPIMLGEEYGFYIKNDLMRLLIRLSRYKFVYRMISENDDVLEVGCGSGLGAMFLSQKCKHVTGIDLRDDEIKEANSIKRRKNVTFLKKDFYKMKSNKKYDVLIALDVIEHMNEEDGKRFLQHTKKYLKKEGMIIIGTPSIYSYPFQGKISQVDHIKCYDLKELELAMQNNFGRILSFSMNDEVVHTGHHKMAWYYFILGFYVNKH